MVTIPGPAPVTVPDEPTVATNVLLLLHVPPAVASVNDVEVPVQMDIGPNGDIAAGVRSTVTVPVTKQLPTV